MEKTKWPEKVTNEQVLQLLGEKRALVNNILHGKVIWIGRILRINWLLHEGQVTKDKGVGRRRRRTQLLYNLRNRGRHWELKEEA